VKYDAVELKKVHGLNFKSMKDNVITMEVEASIINPNSLPITVKEIQMEILNEGESIGSVQTTSKIELPANSEITEKFVIQSEVKNIFLNGLKLLSFLKKKEIEVHLKGHIKAKSLIFTKTVKIDQIEKISR